MHTASVMAVALVTWDLSDFDLQPTRLMKMAFILRTFLSYDLLVSQCHFWGQCVLGGWVGCSLVDEIEMYVPLRTIAASCPSGVLEQEKGCIQNQNPVGLVLWRYLMITKPGSSRGALFVAYGALLCYCVSASLRLTLTGLPP